jgi:hypothetical protein
MRGQQRLGVLVSVTWFFGIWAYVSNVQHKQYWIDWKSSYRICRNNPHDLSRDFEQSQECQAEATRLANTMCCNGVNGEQVMSGQVSWLSWFLWSNQNQIVIAALMTPFWWIFAYMCLWVGRWIKRGFAK